MKKIIASLCVAVLMIGVIGMMPTSAADVQKTMTEQSVADATLVLKHDWHFVVDRTSIGEKEKWYYGFPSKGEKISLPYNHKVSDAATVWYYNEFTPDLNRTGGQRIIATFEGLCYYSKIWINGNYVGENEGAHSRFTFDVTDFIREDQKNLIAMSLFSSQNSTSTINGEDFDQLPVRGAGYQYVQQPVYLSVVPDLAMVDVFVDPRYETGNVDVNIILDNPGTEAVAVDLKADITPSGKNVIVTNGSLSVVAEPGRSTHSFSLHIDNFHSWSPNDPYLYTTTVTAKAEQAAFSDATVVNVGFKDFRIDEDGVFFLNEEQFYVKSIHVTTQSMGPQNTSGCALNVEPMLAQLDFYKASGFNMVRFLGQPGYTELLDHCDRIGLLVYQETGLAWKGDSDGGEELLRREICQTLERDRNHASFAVLGFLNETEDKRIDFEGLNNFHAALKALPLARTYDEDILIFLNSGRWDDDGSVGSASNPGSVTWDACLGDDGVVNEEGKPVVTDRAFMGDVHYYPFMPFDESVRQVYMNYAKHKNGVFVSESGVGSQANIVSNLRIWQQETQGQYQGTDQAMPMIAGLYEVYNQYNMASAYGTPELLLRDTQVHQAQMRGQMFDFIRSNAKISGYSMTMGHDANNRPEGVLENTSDLKDGTYEMLWDGWADTRWCVNFVRYNVYNTDELDVEIYMSDLGKLEHKNYTARFTVTGDEGLVWEKEVDFTPQRDAKGKYVSAVLLLDEVIPLTGLKTGEYRFNADLVGIGISRTRNFWVTDAADLPTLSGTVYTVGFSEKAMRLMQDAGLTCIELDAENIPAGCTVLLGGDNLKNRVLQALYESVKETGTTVVGVNPDSFGNWSYAILPFGGNITQIKMNNYLYHYDMMIFDTPLTDGLQDNCIASSVYYQDVYPSTYFNISQAPDYVFGLAMKLDNGTTGNRNLENGVLGAAYPYGEGYIITHTFLFMDSLGTPVADRMMLNLINFALNNY